MSTQRPFFANFLAAFRAHSAIQQGKATSAPSSSSSHHPQTTHTSPSQPRTITTSTKPSAGATTTALASLHSPRTSTSQLSRSPGPSSNGPMSPNEGGRYMTTSRGRRESDSSSEGFRDVLGTEKWYIGGRTAAGEERYFKLGVVRRQTSRDRLSLDRLSL
ncbi:uncharacterized protein PAC_12457 [Phialocephala subalpina]|uniref:Uncharacterized protein n=1 Tax=Phialocephala subalpina TaxID=576137 RepID=A0A1L7XBY1_9HELO|nr:uncharacterized protein PAC_12457 [Phialocephala subalpina]